MSFDSYIARMQPVQLTRNMLIAQQQYSREIASLREAIEYNRHSEESDEARFLNSRLDEIIALLKENNISSLNEQIIRLNSELSSLNLAGNQYQELKPVSVFDIKPTNRQSIRWIVRLFREAMRQEATPQTAEKTNDTVQRLSKDTGVKVKDQPVKSVKKNTPIIEKSKEISTPKVEDPLSTNDWKQSPFAEQVVLIEGAKDFLNKITPGFVKRALNHRFTWGSSPDAVVDEDSQPKPIYREDISDEPTDQNDPDDEMDSQEAENASEIETLSELLLTVSVANVEQIAEAVADALPDTISGEETAKQVEEIFHLMEEVNLKLSAMGQLLMFQVAMQQELLKARAHELLPTPEPGQSWKPIEGESTLLLEQDNEQVSGTELAVISDSWGVADVPTQPFAEATSADVVDVDYEEVSESEAPSLLDVIPVEAESEQSTDLAPLSEESPLEDLEEQIEAQSQSQLEQAEAAAEQQEEIDEENDEAQAEQHDEVIEELQKSRNASFSIMDLLGSDLFTYAALGSIIAAAFSSPEAMEFLGRAAVLIGEKVFEGIKWALDKFASWVAEKMGWDYDSRITGYDLTDPLNRAKAAAAKGQQVEAPSIWHYDSSTGNIQVGGDETSELGKSLSYLDKLDVKDAVIGAGVVGVGGAAAGAAVGGALTSWSGPGALIGAGLGALVGGVTGWLWKDTSAADKVIAQLQKQGLSEAEAKTTFKALQTIGTDLEDSVSDAMVWLRRGEVKTIRRGSVILDKGTVETFAKSQGWVKEDGSIDKTQIPDKGAEKIFAKAILESKDHVQMVQTGDKLGVVATGPFKKINYNVEKKIKHNTVFRGGMNAGIGYASDEIETTATDFSAGDYADIGTVMSWGGESTFKTREHRGKFQTTIKEKLEEIKAANTYYSSQGSGVTVNHDSFGTGLEATRLQTYSGKKKSYVYEREENSGNKKRIHDALIRAGYTEQATAGILSNIWSESRFDPKAANPESSARGIMQWMKSTRAAMAKAGFRDFTTLNNWDTLDVQIPYMLNYLKFTGLTPDKLKNDNPQTAALRVLVGAEAGAYKDLNAAFSPEGQKKLQMRQGEQFYRAPEIRSKNAAVFYNERESDYVPQAKVSETQSNTPLSSAQTEDLLYAQVDSSLNNPQIYEPQQTDGQVQALAQVDTVDEVQVQTTVSAITLPEIRTEQSSQPPYDFIADNATSPEVTNNNSFSQQTTTTVIVNDLVNIG